MGCLCPSLRRERGSSGSEEDNWRAGEASGESTSGKRPLKPGNNTPRKAGGAGDTLAGLYRGADGP